MKPILITLVILVFLFGCTQNIEPESDSLENQDIEDESAPVNDTPLNDDEPVSNGLQNNSVEPGSNGQPLNDTINGPQENETVVVPEAKEYEKFLIWNKSGRAVEGGISSSSVIRDDKIMMYYVGDGGIALAESTDGLNFEKVGVILEPQNFRTEFFSNPGIMELEDGRLRMVYEVSSPPPNQHDRRLYSAISSDGITWEREAGERYSDVDPQGFVFTSVPDLIEAEAELYLFYTSGDVSRIAKSSDAGLTWTKWKEVNVDTYSIVLDPDVSQIGDNEYLLLFTTFPNNRFGFGEQVIVASSSDETFDFESAYVVEIEGENTEVILDPELVNFNNRYFLYYSVLEEQSSSIYVAKLD